MVPHARRILVTSVAAVVAWTNYAAAQVLKQVPADAVVVVKVTNAKQVSDKIAKLANTFGAAPFVPQLNDPLAFVKEELGVAQGLNEGGDIAFAMIDPGEGASWARSMVVLIPVSDYQQFVGNFQGATTEGDVTSARINGAPSFVAKWGDYAAVSPAREVVAKAPATAIEVKGLSAREMQGKDIALYANTEKLRTTVIPALKQARPDLIAEIEQNMAANPDQAAYVPVAKAAANRGLDVVEAFFTDTNGATIGLSLGDAGIGTTVLADFKSDSYIGQKMAAIKPGGEALVRGLPEGEYLMYGGFAVQGNAVSQIINDVAEPVLAELNRLETPEAAQIKSAVDAAKKFIGAVNSQSFGLMSTKGQLAQDPIFKQIQVTRGDAKTLAETQTTLLKASQELMNIMPGEQPVKMAFEVEPGATTVDGVKFDTVTATVEGDAQSPQAMQMQQMMGMMYGADGFTGYNGVVDAKTYLTTGGVPEAELSDLIKAVKADGKALVGAEHVQSVAKALPQQRIGEMYFAVDNWVRAGAHYATAAGMPVQIQLPPDLPPIGVAVATEGSALRIDSYIPTDLVQSLVAAGMQAFQAAQRGGPGGPGGL